MARIREFNWVMIDDGDDAGKVGQVVEVTRDDQIAVQLIGETDNRIREENLTLLPNPPHSTEPPTAIRYRNYRGEIATRYVVPLRIYWGSNEWHPSPQWLIDAYDMTKRSPRTFAVAGLLPPEAEWCPLCEGFGVASSSSLNPCPQCDGRGFVTDHK